MLAPTQPGAVPARADGGIGAKSRPWGSNLNKSTWENSLQPRSSVHFLRDGRAPAKLKISPIPTTGQCLLFLWSHLVHFQIIREKARPAEINNMFMDSILVASGFRLNLFWFSLGCLPTFMQRNLTQN